MTIHGRIAMLTALATLAIGASAIPASARPFDLNANGSFVPAGMAAGSTSAPTSAQLTATAQTERQAAADRAPSGADRRSSLSSPAASSITSGAVSPATRGGGFDWGDAGIGAAGAIVLAMLGLGGALVIYQRHPRHNRRPA
jgi:hypothetical protein